MFSPSANRSKHLESLINRMMAPDPTHRPTIDEILLHPCFTSCDMMQEQRTVPQNSQGVILISPSTVAQETMSRQSVAPFEIANDK